MLYLSVLALALPPAAVPAPGGPASDILPAAVLVAALLWVALLYWWARPARRSAPWPDGVCSGNRAVPPGHAPCLVRPEAAWHDARDVSAEPRGAAQMLEPTTPSPRGRARDPAPGGIYFGTDASTAALSHSVSCWALPPRPVRASPPALCPLAIPALAIVRTAAPEPAKRRSRARCRVRRLPFHTNGVGSWFQPATVCSNQSMICCGVCGSCPARARRTRMRCIDSAIFSQDPPSGV